jgi:hypothetical protein
MYVIRLPNGNLRVPHSAVLTDATPDAERIIGQGYIEIGPDDPDYSRLSDGALTDEEFEEKRRRWREEDAEVLQLFEEWKAGQPET